MGPQLPLRLCFCYPNAFSTSSASGIDGIAPIPCTAKLEARWAYVIADSKFPRLGLNCELSAPINVSPAAVVSTGFTLNAGTNPW